MSAPDGAEAHPRSRISLLLLVLILALSAFIQLTVVSRTRVDVPLRVDAGEYFSYAYNLSHHGVYSAAQSWKGKTPARAPQADSFRPPGYPFFLTLVGTPEPTPAFLRRVSLVQATLGVLSVWLTFLIAFQFLGNGSALLVAMLTALSPQLAVISTYLLTESLFCFLLLASVLATIKAMPSEGISRWVLSGLLWGACSMVRPTSLFLLPLLVLAITVVPQFRPLRWRAVIALAAFAAVLLPWTIRNHASHVAAPTASLMVKSLAHGSYPDYMYEGRKESFGYPYRFDPESENISKDLPSLLRHVASKFRLQPLEYGRWYLIGKPISFLSWNDAQQIDIFIYPVRSSPYIEDGRFVAIRMTARVLHGPLMLLGLAGAFLALFGARRLFEHSPRTGAAAVVGIVVLYAVAFHMVVAPLARYAVPFLPLLFSMAMLSLSVAHARWRTRRWGVEPAK